MIAFVCMVLPLVCLVSWLCSASSLSFFRLINEHFNLTNCQEGNILTVQILNSTLSVTKRRLTLA